MRDRFWACLRNLALAAILVVSGICREASAALAQSTAQAKTTTAKLERGRVLEFELLTNLDSESAKVGDHLTLKLTQPVHDAAGDELLPAGWIAAAHVTKVHRAGKTNCRDGSVSWEFDPSKAPDGTPVRLSSSWRGIPTADPPETVGHKFEDVVGTAVVAPLFILALPFEILIGIGEDTCHGRPGQPERLQGMWQRAVVTKDVQLSAATVATAGTPARN